MSDNALVVLYAHKHPAASRDDAAVVMVSPNRTLQAMLDEAAQGRELEPTLRVEIGGYEVPPEFWPRVRPKPGTAIHCTVMPAGGSGGKLLRTVLLVALTVFTAGVAGGAYLAGASVLGLSGSTLAAAISIVGMLAINALIPPPKPPGAGPDPGRLYGLTGSSNQLNPYGAIPLVLGESKIFPPHAAMPYSETLGDTSYQRLMFDLGYGDLEVSDIKIGDTDLAEFEDVQYEITTTPTLYTADVSEAVIAAAMNDSDTETRTTAPDTDEITLDIVFPQGLFGVSNKGKLKTVTAEITVEFRAAGSADPWVAVYQGGGGTLPRFTGFAGVTAAALEVRTSNRDPFAVGVAWEVPAGQYDVRVTRGATDWDGTPTDNQIGDAQWTVLRSIRHTAPSTTGTTKLCMRIKASEQLNGTLQTLSCVVQQKIPVYDAGTETWSAPAANFNTAWVMHWLLTECPAVSIHVPSSRIDLDSFVAYADFCTENEFETRGVVDARTTLAQLVDEVLACSLGARLHRDGSYGILFDDGSTVPTMAFTPLDSRNFVARRIFTRQPHALRVRFRNPAAFWELDEIVVLNDGYSYRGVDARGDASADPEATEFEVLELRYSCDAYSAWRLGRHHMAQALYRPNTYAWETDVANLGCARGDCVHVTHDVTEWGAGAGRVVSLTAGGYGGAAATLVLDETIETQAATSYSVRIRRSDGSTVLASATPHSVQTETFYLATLPADVEPGDAVMVVETAQDTAKLLLTGISPGPDLSARLTAVAYDDRVAPYWANPPAVIVSEVSGTTYRDAPPPPDITIIVTDPVNQSPDDAGTQNPGVIVRLPMPGGFSPPRSER